MSKNSKPREIRIMLDKERTMRFDLNAIEALEDMTGKSITQGEFKGASLKDIRAFFTACLKWEDEEVTEEMVGGHLFIHHLPEATDIMMRLMTGKDADPESLAPYVPTPTEVAEKAIALSGLKAGETFVDLGCGDGRILALAAKTGAKVIGFEKDKGRAEVSRNLLKEMGYADQGVVIEGLIQDADVSSGDVVFIYLLTSSNTALIGKLVTQLKPGSRVVTHDFPFVGWTAIAHESLEAEGRDHQVFVYEIGKHLTLEVAEGVQE